MFHNISRPDFYKGVGWIAVYIVLVSALGLWKLVELLSNISISWG